MALTQVDGGLLSPTNGQFYGFKNRIINGNMVIDQRNAGAAVTPTGASQYTIDRFIGVNTQASKLTYQQVADAPSGFVNSFKILVASAATPSSSDQFRVGQSIEGFNTADFGWGTASAQAVTVSFRAKVSVAGTYSVAIWNGANGRSYVTTVSLTTSWATYSVTFPGDTSGTWGTGNTVGIELIFDTGAGSDWVAPANNAWQAGNYFKASGSVSLVSNASATLNITGVQLEKGSTATSFDYRPYGTELALCQRYCQAYTGTSVFGVSSTGFYGDANSITQMPSSWLNGAILRSPLTASLTMVGTQGTDWAITTSGGTPQTGFTLSLSGGVVIGCSKTGHGLTPSNTFAYLQTSSGKAIVTSEL